MTKYIAETDFFNRVLAYLEKGYLWDVLIKLWILNYAKFLLHQNVI